MKCFAVIWQVVMKRDMAKCLFEGGMNGLVIGIAV